MDDVSGQTSSELSGELAMQDLSQKVQKSGQIWSILQDIAGHGLAFHKEYWRAVAWKALNGRLK